MELKCGDNLQELLNAIPEFSDAEQPRESVDSGIIPLIVGPVAGILLLTLIIVLLKRWVVELTRMLSLYFSSFLVDHPLPKKCIKKFKQFSKMKLIYIMSYRHKYMYFCQIDEVSDEVFLFFI